VHLRRAPLLCVFFEGDLASVLRDMFVARSYTAMAYLLAIMQERPTLKSVA